MTIDYTNQAILDLEDIQAFTFERWGQNQADLYLGQLRVTILRLSDFPLLGLESDVPGNRIRRLKAGQHTVFYRVINSHSVRILRIIHASRLIDTTEIPD